jgi:hypothetical protein
VLDPADLAKLKPRVDQTVKDMETWGSDEKPEGRMKPYSVRGVGRIDHYLEAPSSINGRHSFGYASTSPFVSERGKAPMVNPEWKMERQWGRETVYLFQARPGAGNRCLHDRHRQRTFTNYACRLTGRIKSGGRTAMSLWLGELPSVRCLGVQVLNNGELTVERVPWSKTAFALPGQKPISDEAILPGDQANEVLGH